MNKSKHIFIVLLIISVILLIINATGLYIGICALISQWKAYPQPIDSFWTIDLAVALIVVCAFLFIVSVCGVVYSLIKLKA